MPRSVVSQSCRKVKNISSYNARTFWVTMLDCVWSARSVRANYRLNLSDWPSLCYKLLHRMVYFIHIIWLGGGKRDISQRPERFTSPKEHQRTLRNAFHRCIRRYSPHSDTQSCLIFETWNLWCPQLRQELSRSFLNQYWELRNIERRDVIGAHWHFQSYIY